MSFARNLTPPALRPGGKHGLSRSESRDPIGLAVAALNRVAQSDLIDRIGLRKQAEQAVFTATRSGFKTATTAGRAFAKAGKRGQGGTRPTPVTPPKGTFDLTPTEDEQMLVDVVTEFATEVLRPAAAEADEKCEAPEDLLKASLEIGLPILGVPEALGGISEERSAMAGTLVAEALAKGDFAAYGEQQKKLSAALQRAIDAEAKITTPTPAPSPAATPAPSGSASPSATPAPSGSASPSATPSPSK